MTVLSRQDRERVWTDGLHRTDRCEDCGYYMVEHSTTCVERRPSRAVLPAQAYEVGFYGDE
jgi:hypothetical protein